MAAYKIITGDVLAELKKLSSDHFDAVLSDYPQARDEYRDDNTYQDAGGASRFFYCPKVSTAERNAGCDQFEEKLYVQFQTANGTSGKASSISEGRNTRYRNQHPTLKPIALTEYLARLLLPPKQKGKTRRILVPFSGAGSEIIGCLKAGWDEVWGIELSDEYVDIAHARIAHHTKAKKI